MIALGCAMFAAVLAMGTVTVDAKGKGQHCRAGFDHCFDKCEARGGTRTGTKTREAGCAKKCAKKCATR